MQARFYANMRTVIGRTSLEVGDARVDTFRKLVNHLIEQFPDAKFHLLDPNDELRQDVPVYVVPRNSRNLRDKRSTAQYYLSTNEAIDRWRRISRKIKSAVGSAKAR